MTDEQLIYGAIATGASVWVGRLTAGDIGVSVSFMEPGGTRTTFVLDAASAIELHVQLTEIRQRLADGIPLNVGADAQKGAAT